MGLHNTSSTIATIVIAFLAAVATFFAIWKLTETKQVQEHIEDISVNIYTPSEELSNEMYDAATTLLKNNHTIVRLYFTRRLPTLEEPYGNKPEDGYYTVDDKHYKVLEDVTKIVRETFVDKERDRILTDPSGVGPVYNNRNGELGLNMNFVPLEYDISWESVSFKLTPKADTECKMEIILKDKDGNNVVRSGNMVKENDKWKLSTLII